MTSHNHLLRSHAPIPVRAWEAIDAEAKERLTPLLATRRLTDLVGPGGWRHDAMSLGRTTRLSSVPSGVAAADSVISRQRRVLPLAEIRVPFTVSRDEVDDIQRGALDPELDDLARAARLAAEIENRAVFHGWAEAGITGIAPSSPYATATMGGDTDRYPSFVAMALDELRRAGIEGPYALALGPVLYTTIVESAEHGGYPLVDHLTRILGSGASIVRAPGLDGAVVLSQRGDDFLLDIGQDLSVGYSHHDAELVHLYLEESFTFLVAEPDAAIALA